MEYNCFAMLCLFLLYNEVNQLYVYIYPFPLGLPHLHSTYLKSSQNWAELSSLCCTAGSHLLSILCMVVDLCETWSPHSSYPLLTPLHPHVRSLHLPLYYSLELSSSVPYILSLLILLSNLWLFLSVQDGCQMPLATRFLAHAYSGKCGSIFSNAVL